MCQYILLSFFYTPLLLAKLGPFLAKRRLFYTGKEAVYCCTVRQVFLRRFATNHHVRSHHKFQTQQKMQSGISEAPQHWRETPLSVRVNLRLPCGRLGVTQLGSRQTCANPRAGQSEMCLPQTLNSSSRVSRTCEVAAELRTNQIKHTPGPFCVRSTLFQRGKPPL